ncbi:PTS sugar transporter subunit IIA [Enterococcus gallinarum]|uniref:PTS sugar transporter subunit IIA n=1 Tax=Enterococcus gallinarum TaxID=1353 RepID=UPI002890E89E|nr:PTS sugar transporter subunit IIA [Enterococcus gallinarum]MDT2719673.1 PTS sugar transporter subunit IIA [Enterococcus gallinarum]
MKIVLASHSNLAQGMKDTAEFIMGKQENLSAITAYVDEKVDFTAQLTALISEMAEEPIIFISDLLGGSVNRVITETIAGKENQFLIAGMNLPLVLEIVSMHFSEEPTQVKEQLQQVIVTATSGVKLIEVNSDQPDEDEF